MCHGNRVTVAFYIPSLGAELGIHLIWQAGVLGSLLLLLLERVMIASTGNGSTWYLSQH